MTEMHSKLPDDRKWTFYKEAKGDILAGSALLPPSEVAAFLNVIDYLTEQLAACHAAASH